MHRSARDIDTQLGIRLTMPELYNNALIGRSAPPPVRGAPAPRRPRASSGAPSRRRSDETQLQGPCPFRCPYPYRFLFPYLFPFPYLCRFPYLFRFPYPFRFPYLFRFPYPFRFPCPFRCPCPFPCQPLSLDGRCQGARREASLCLLRVPLPLRAAPSRPPAPSPLSLRVGPWLSEIPPGAGPRADSCR